MNYEDYPIVQLKEEIEKEEWFKLASGTFHCPTKARFSSNNPLKATIEIEYEGECCKVEAYDNVRLAGRKNGMFAFRIKKPDYAYKNIKRRPNSVEAAVKNLSTIFAEMTDKIDEELPKIEAKRKEIEEAIELREKVMALFDVNIQPIENPTWTKYYDRLVFKMSQQFSVDFRFVKNGEGKVQFYIDDVDGGFSLETMKKIINIVATCPEAAADRILSGK